MSKKTVSAIMMFLLLLGMIALAFKIQIVRADDGTIYINADGSISPSTAPIYTEDNITYTLTGNITANANGIVIERNNIVLNGAGYTMTRSDYSILSRNGIMLDNMRNVTINNMTITNFDTGISLSSSSNCTLSGNNVMNNDWGFSLYSSSNNVLSGNNVTANNDYGIWLDYSSNSTLSGNSVTASINPGILLESSSGNILSGNNVTANYLDGIVLTMSSNNNTLSGNDVIANYSWGILLLSSSNNTIYDNNFINNTYAQVYSSDSTNVWDNGSLGNYWSDYLTKYPNATETDGVWNTPYVIDANNTDSYPLMHPYSSIRNLNSNLSYLTIQGAINNANDGDTIFVRSGTYYENVVVNKTVSIIGEDKVDTIIDGNGTGTVIHILRNGVNITGFTIQNSDTYWLLNAGIYIDNNITNSHIVRNDIINDKVGVLIIDAEYNYISGNDIKNDSEAGFLLWTASYNNITNNNITYNYHGLELDESPANIFFHNNFANNTSQMVDATPANPSVCVWDNGYPSGGNYWSDYKGTDSNGDGIGDTPYIVDSNNLDNYPLMNLWTSADIAVMNLTSAKTVIGQGFTTSVNVNFENLGSKIEAFNATVCANSTFICSEPTELAMTNDTVSFVWNTTGFAYGYYTITASAEFDPSENASTNNCTCSAIVTIPGDVSGDFKVSLHDLVLLANAYGTTPASGGTPGVRQAWNPNADINGNGVVDLTDLVILALHYGQHYP